MTTNNNLDALFADGELPFGHPGRRSDDTPEGFEPSPLVDQGPEPDYTPDEDGRVVHYCPGDRPLCGSESMNAAYTDDPAVKGGDRVGHWGGGIVYHRHERLTSVDQTEGRQWRSRNGQRCQRVMRCPGLRDAGLSSGPLQPG